MLVTIGEMMIKPTVGRVVWFWPNGVHMDCKKSDVQPMAATIAYVNNDRSVNLSLVDHGGNQLPFSHVLLVQGDENVKPTGAYCEWMPYQVGQAKKDEPSLTLTRSQIGDVSQTEVKLHADGGITITGAANVSGTFAGDPPVDTVKPASAVTDEMVSRFLRWPMPKDFAPDGSVSFNEDAASSRNGWPIGTNLLHAGQARAMLEHVLGAVDPDQQIIDSLAPDTRPKDPKAAAITGETGAEQQLSQLVAPEYVEVRKFIPGPRIADVQEEWARCKVEDSSDWEHGTLVVRDGMTLRQVRMGLNCRRADTPAKPFDLGVVAGTGASRVTMAGIEDKIVGNYFFTAEQGVHAAGYRDKGCPGLGNVTICVLVLRNGTRVVGVNYGSDDSTQHSASRGRIDARKDAVNKIWELEGYLRRERLAQGGAA